MANGRMKARECAYKLVFEFLFQGEYNVDTLSLLTADDKFSKSDEEYIEKLYKGICAEFKELSEYILKFCTVLSVERLAKPDFAALLIAVYELKNLKDEIPHRVAINEAVELSKEYSSAEGYKFVNGVLSSIYKVLCTM